VYDVHTHVGIDQGFFLRGWWPYAATAQDLLQHMDAHGVDRAVCFPFCLSSGYDSQAFAHEQRVALLPGRTPYDPDNALLAQELDRIDPRGPSQRLFMLAMFDPSREVPGQVRSLEKLIGRIAGLKVQGTVIESPVAALLKVGKPIMELASAYKFPVLMHTSIIPTDTWSQTADCLRVAEAYPEARFNLAHSLRMHVPSLRRAAQIGNVWVDCSAHLAHCQLARLNSPVVAARHERIDADFTRPDQVLVAIHQILGPRLLWGSDNPYMSWCDDTMKLMYSYRDETDVLHALPPAVQGSIAGTAPEAWLFGKPS